MLDAQAAERSYHDALTMATELAMRPLAAHCHAGLSTLYRRTASAARSQEHAKSASTLYRELGMTHWLGPMEPSRTAGCHSRGDRSPSQSSP
jgi:hypothetical protein